MAKAEAITCNAGHGCIGTVDYSGIGSMPWTAFANLPDGTTGDSRHKGRDAAVSWVKDQHEASVTTPGRPCTYGECDLLYEGYNSAGETVYVSTRINEDGVEEVDRILREEDLETESWSW